MSRASYKLQPLCTEEVARHGFSHMAIITADDLTTTTTNTAQTFTLGTIPDGAELIQGEARLIVPFEDKSDTAYNSTTVSLGDAGSATRYVSAAQCNKNGTEITEPVFENTAYQNTANTDLVLTVNSMSGKALNDIDKGELHIFVKIQNTKTLSDAKGLALIQK